MINAAPPAPPEASTTPSTNRRPGSAEKSTSKGSATNVKPTLKTSWAYQHRLGVTAVVLVAAWVFVALTPAPLAEGSPLAWGLNAAGWLSFLAGSFLRIWATTWITGRKKTTVVDDGPYGICRNPLYVGTFLMGLGLALILKSVVFGCALVLLVAMYARFVVPAEEAYLAQRLGDSYRRYCADVRAWIPSLRGLRRRPEVGQPMADRPGLRGEWLRMIWWTLLPLLAVATCYVRPLAVLISR